MFQTKRKLRRQLEELKEVNGHLQKKIIALSKQECKPSDLCLHCKHYLGFNSDGDALCEFLCECDYFDPNLSALYTDNSIKLG